MSRDEKVFHGLHKVTVDQMRYETQDGPEREVDIRLELDAGEPEAEERLLDGVGLDIQEAWLCEDLLYALQVGHAVPCPSDQKLIRTQGVEGSLIRYDDLYDPMDEDQRLRGVKWKLDPSISEPLSLTTS